MGDITTGKKPYRLGQEEIANVENVSRIVNVYCSLSGQGGRWWNEIGERFHSKDASCESMVE